MLTYGKKMSAGSLTGLVAQRDIRASSRAATFGSLSCSVIVLPAVSAVATTSINSGIM
jgi:hypothetical protein